jgi:hypothetical protein
MFQDGCARVAGPDSDTRAESGPDRGPKPTWLVERPSRVCLPRSTSRDASGAEMGGDRARLRPRCFIQDRACCLSASLHCRRFDLNLALCFRPQEDRSVPHHATDEGFGVGTVEVWTRFLKAEAEEQLGGGGLSGGIAGPGGGKRRILTPPQSLSEFVSACLPMPSV